MHGIELVEISSHDVVTYPYDQNNVMKLSNNNNNRNFGFSNSCQPDGDLCFNAGGDDVFCCSGKCGSNRRCKSSNSGSNDNFDIAPSPAANPTAKPKSRRPSKVPSTAPLSDKPTRKSSRKPQPTTQSSVAFTQKSSDNGCDSGKVKVTVEIKTDKWGAGKLHQVLIHPEMSCLTS